MVDEELQRLFAVLQAAETEWREHRLSGWQVYYGTGEAIGKGDTNPFTREWREREQTLRAAFDAAHAAWLSHLPEPNQ